MFVKLTVLACIVAAAVAQSSYQGPLAGGQPAAQFPAGINPQSCPNYPNCENPAVAVSQQVAPQHQYQQPQQQYQQQQQPQSYQQYHQQAPQQQQYQPSPISQYNPVLAQQYNPAPSQQYSAGAQDALNRGEYIGDGDYHGEGLAEALAPGHAAPAAPAYRQAYQQQPAPQAYNQPRAYNPAPVHQQQHQQQPAQIPAGVDPNACPNYPFCH